MLVSPAEPANLRSIGTTSSLPEKYGADFLISIGKGFVGVQRKEVKDFLASLSDGRLSKELAQLQALPHRVLIIEGPVKFTNDGYLLTGSNYGGQQISKKAWKGLLWSVRSKGVWVETSEDITDTGVILQWLESWFKRPKHTSLDSRPGPISMWGKPSNEDYQRHLVMGLPGVGTELADRIVKTFGVPFSWRIKKEELLQVPGIGKKKAESIWGALEVAEVVDG